MERLKKIFSLLVPQNRINSKDVPKKITTSFQSKIYNSFFPGNSQNFVCRSGIIHIELIARGDLPQTNCWCM